ncbi:MAG: agmatine deiminase family protein [Pseudomonadota bacterium]
MPAEWHPHKRTWMAWPSAHPQWGDIDAVEQDYADVANAIAQFEPVTMVVNPPDLPRARARCGEGVDVLSIPIDDSWMRDSGPSFVRHEETGEVAGTAWRFNCWGGYTPVYQEDAQLAGRVLDHLDMHAYRSSLVLEGGAIHVDGEGTLVTTESVVLNANRNWGMNHKEAEIELCRATGARKVIWLPGDLDAVTSDMTDGHVDGVMCFVKPGVVMVEKDLSADPVIANLEAENRRALELATDANGRNLEIIDLEVEHDSIGEGFELFCSSYINYYLPNGGLVMPCYGVRADLDVRELLAGVFSDRKIVMVDINAIAPGGGGIHCITQQQPR